MLWSPKKTFPCRHLDHSSSRTKQSPTTKQALRSAKLLWNLPVASLTNEAYSHAFSFLAAISRHNVQRTLKFVFGCSKHQRLPVKVSKKVPICLLTSTLWWTRKYCCLGFEPGVWTVRNLWEGCISHHFCMASLESHIRISKWDTHFAGKGDGKPSLCPLSCPARPGVLQWEIVYPSLHYKAVQKPGVSNFRLENSDRWFKGTLLKLLRGAGWQKSVQGNPTAKKWMDHDLLFSQFTLKELWSWTASDLQVALKPTSMSLSELVFQPRDSTEMDAFVFSKF